MAASKSCYENGESSYGIKDGGNWIISMREEEPLPHKKNKIQKVAPQLRKGRNEFFDPAVVSIGPLHHAKPELQEMENVKARMARAFVADSKRDIHEFRDKLLEVVSDARNCYVDGSTGAYDDEAFGRMMFVDGCFLLHLIDKVLPGNYKDLEELAGHLGFGRWPMLIGDLILLENQLPFLVLQTLMSVRFPGDEGEGLIETYIDVYFVQDLEARKMMTSGQRSKGTKYDGDQQPLHLLELTRRRFLGSTNGEQWRSATPSSTMTGHGQISSTEEGPRKEGQPGRSRLRGHRATKQINFFRSATELKARGIHFWPCNTFFLNDFTFSSRFLHGRLTLPQVMVDIQTKRVFLNMMADELAPFRFGVQETCNYIYFMNSLINGADDVIELRSHRIIHNLLGTDEEVAKLFNTLAAFCGYPLLSNKTEVVITGIEDHYNSKRKTWTAQLLHKYFSSPWTALAFFAATFALTLTLIQTFFPR